MKVSVKLKPRNENDLVFINFRETKDFRQALNARARQDLGMTIDELCRKCLGAFIEMDLQILKALEQEANKRNVTIGQIINDALAHHLNK